MDMARSWRWQKCTELAYLQPGYAGSLRHAALSLDQLVEQCVYVFGEDAVPPNCGTEKTNARYGGATGITATKIVFLDYSDDPWQVRRFFVIFSSFFDLFESFLVWRALG